MWLQLYDALLPPEPAVKMLPSALLCRCITAAPPSVAREPCLCRFHQMLIQLLNRRQTEAAAEETLPQSNTQQAPTLLFSAGFVYMRLCLSRRLFLTHRLHILHFFLAQPASSLSPPFVSGCRSSCKVSDYSLKAAARQQQKKKCCIQRRVIVGGGNKPWEVIYFRSSNKH